MATTPVTDDDRVPRRRAPRAVSAVAVLAACASVVYALTLSDAPAVGPSDGVLSPSPSALPSASVAANDFRFLPALSQPPIVPKPSPVPVAQGTLAVSLVAERTAAENAASVAVAWAGADGKAIRTGATIQAGIDGGPLQTVNVPNGASQLQRRVVTGHDYAYRLDLASTSTSGASSTVTGFRLRSVDDRDAAVTYQGVWSSAGFAGYQGHAARFSETPGATATFQFTAQSVALVGPAGPGRGTATIEVDGHAAGTVSEAAAHFEPRRMLFVRSWPTSGQHVIRLTVAGRRGAPVAVDSFTVVGPADHPPEQPAPPPSEPGAVLPDATLPLRAAFYYGWYPEAWQQQDSSTYSNYHPSLGAYDSSNPQVLANQIQAMRYGGIGAGIASWWGPGTRTDGRLPQLLAAARGTGLSWAINDEVEEVADPDVASITTTLAYINDHFANDPGYLRINGRFVVFVGAGPNDSCDLAQRWTAANSVHAYLILAAVPGHESCPSQPDDWYGPNPSAGDQQDGQSSYEISAGFWRPGSSPVLERDVTRWGQSVKSMMASGARFQLIASFNQWADGSSVESAQEWASASGYGQYLDVLHDNGAVSTPPDNGQTDPVLVGAGAIAACDSTNDEATAQIVSTIPGTVFTVGDSAFDSGTLDEYRNCYGPSWGAFLDRTHPAPGTRDYLTADAAGYFGYFGAAAGPPDKGYYAYDLGTWRIYVLNSNCTKIGGCGVGSPQEEWLRADLAAHPSHCIGAYWQEARFSAGRFGDDPRMQPFWQDLYDHGAEFVVNGHDHNYQRYAPMTPAGQRDPTKGIREFIVGTGGNGHTSIRSGSIPNREAANDQAYGVLRLTLHATGYEWQFLSTPRSPYSDAGAEACH